MGNPFVYVQLQTKDLEKAKSFYQELFDWKYDELSTGVGPYVEVRVGEGTGGGMVGNRAPDKPSRWVPYIVVTNIDDTTAKARALGAQVEGPFPLPNKSRFSVITDPTGAVFALHQPGAAQ